MKTSEEIQNLIWWTSAVNTFALVFLSATIKIHCTQLVLCYFGVNTVTIIKTTILSIGTITFGIILVQCKCYLESPLQFSGQKEVKNLSLNLPLSHFFLD